MYFVLRKSIRGNVILLKARALTEEVDDVTSARRPAVRPVEAEAAVETDWPSRTIVVTSWAWSALPSPEPTSFMPTPVRREPEVFLRDYTAGAVTIVKVNYTLDFSRFPRGGALIVELPEGFDAANATLLDTVGFDTASAPEPTCGAFP